MKILAINPGSTSTKIALFEDEKNLFTENITHSVEKLNEFENLISQKDFRRNEVLEVLKNKGYTLEELGAVVGRGGLLKAIPSGTYNINDKMIDDLTIGVSGEHASNLGGIIAKEIATTIDVPSYIVDPVVVDELQDVARLTGIKGIKRISIFHALNQKAVAKRFAKENNTDYEKLNIIVAHLGGGTSVGIHKKGKVIDVNNALGGEGAFSPERAGSINATEFFKFTKGKEEKEIKLALKGKGGLVSYFNTSDCRDVVGLMEQGNEEAKLVLDAMAYGIAKEIGALATVNGGEIDAIILTGGIAYSSYITSIVEKSVKFIAPVTIYPGENEMEALVQGALRVLNNEETALNYK